jgi:hypothetical protein
LRFECVLNISGRIGSQILSNLSSVGAELRITAMHPAVLYGLAVCMYLSGPPGTESGLWTLVSFLFDDGLCHYHPPGK